MSDQTRQNGQAQLDAWAGQTGRPGGPGRDQPETRRRVSVREAARLLNTTVEGVRSRIKRGTLDSERVEGAVYVLLTPDQAQPAGDRAETGRPGALGEPDAVAPLVEELKDRVRSLETQLSEERTANRENRRIIAALVQRVPELEAASETRETPQTASPRPDRGAGYPDEEGAQAPSWWRRVFGLA